jgi:hypothetical protein
LFMTVPPQRTLLDQKEQNQPNQNSGQNRFAGKLVQGMRNHAEKCRSQQSADRIRDQTGCNKRELLPFEKEQPGSESDRANRPKQSESYYQEKIHFDQSNRRALFVRV